MVSTLQQRAIESQSTDTDVASNQLRSRMAAMRLSFHWLGTRKSLNTEQKARAADAFDAEGKFLGANKKLIDTSDATFRQVTAIRTQATAYYKSVSLPFPEPGIRLIRQDSIKKIDSAMQVFRDELVVAVGQLEQHFAQLTQEARCRLGDLFDPSDYPASLDGTFAIEWSFPTVEAPEYLRRLNPTLYQQECQRVQAQFDDAVRMAETAFVEELSKLIEHLAERLTGAADGQPRIFRDSAIGNVDEFFHRFRSLNIGSNEQLDVLVNQAQQILAGVDPQSLRDRSDLRQSVATNLSSVQASLDGLMVDRPRRNIIRGPR